MIATFTFIFSLLFLILSGKPLAGANGGKGYGRAEADFGISVKLGPKVRIWGLENFDLSGTAAASSLTKPICIYSNSDVGFVASVVTENQFKLVNNGNTGASYYITMYMNPGKNTKEDDGIWRGDGGGTDISFYGVASVDLSPEILCDSTTSNVDLTVVMDRVTSQQGFYSDRVMITISPL